MSRTLFGLCDVTAALFARMALRFRFANGVVSVHRSDSGVHLGLIPVRYCSAKSAVHKSGCEIVVVLIFGKRF